MPCPYKHNGCNGPENSDLVCSACSLDNFLHTIYDKRSEIFSAYDGSGIRQQEFIYGLYEGTQKETPHITDEEKDTQLKGFLKKLCGLSQWASDYFFDRVLIQATDDPREKLKIGPFMKYLHDVYLSKDPRTFSPNLRDDLMEDFYHLWARNEDDEDKQVTQRIYINTREWKTEAALAVFEKIFTSVLFEQGNAKKPNMNIDEAKVAGPAMLGRNDTIIIYLYEESAITDVKKIIEGFEPELMKLIGPKIPPMTQGLIKGKGVAQGAEPPELGFIDKNTPAVNHGDNKSRVMDASSFGSYRSYLIAQIFQEHSKFDSIENFSKAVKQRFWEYGINPNTPHLNEKVLETPQSGPYPT
ncbi:T3SS effector HopA1 family protein [Nitrospira sp. MA-1]|nr:T3SS effector HopA1 family protein [Nitrospira sp. MA-1]